MGGSLRAGLSALLAAHSAISAVIFLACDQPLLSATTLGILIATHQQTGSAIAASEYGGALGVPALFARSMFAKLLALEGKEGARQIIHTHRDQVAAVPFPDGAVDLDTPADYAAFHESSNAMPVLNSRKSFRSYFRSRHHTPPRSTSLPTPTPEQAHSARKSRRLRVAIPLASPPPESSR